MCQQHSITTQPSRPSKARPVQRPPQLLLRTLMMSGRGGMLWYTQLSFYSSRIWLFDWGGHRHHPYCPAFPKITCCPKKNKKKTTNQHLFCFYSFSFFFNSFCLVLSRVCVMFTSQNLKQVFLPERRIDLVAHGSDRTRIMPYVTNGKKAGEVKLTLLETSKRVKKRSV